METGLVIAAAAFGGVMLGVFHLRSRRRRRRSNELHELALELGWQFDPRRDFRHDDRYAAFEVFRRGSAGMARDTLWGTFEVRGVRFPAKAGDFAYVVDHVVGPRYPRQRIADFSYLVVHLPFPDPPDLRIAPAGSVPGPGEPLGDGQLEYERGDFRRSFEVTSSSPEFADRLLDRSLQELLAAMPGPTIEVVGGRMCLADGRRRWTAQQFRAAMKIAGELVSRWKAAAG